jgi:hypothetical protein
MKKELTYKPPKGWNYCGDISLEYGGYFYKASEWGLRGCNRSPTLFRCGLPRQRLVGIPGQCNP